MDAAKLDLGTTTLVLVSAAIHASWNALLKRTRTPEDAVIGGSTISALAAIALAVALGVPVPSGASIGYCVASGVLEAAYFATLARALTRAPFGPVYTIVRGGALVLVWPISVLALGERVTGSTMAGTVLVVLGLVATGASERSHEGKEMRLGWAIVCAAFVGGYQVIYKLGLATGAAPSFVNAASLATAAVVNVAAGGTARAKRGWAATRAEPVNVAAAGILASVGFVVFLVAMKDAGAGLVVTLRNTSILFAQGIAFAMGERPKRLGIAGAVLVTAGAVLLSVRR